MNVYKIIFLLLTVLLVSVSCTKTSKNPQNSENRSVQVPVFDADSAYWFIEQQVHFGPRVPNSKSHKECGVWLEEELVRFGADVKLQEVNLTAFDGTILEAKNIIASYNPEIKKRILLFAHWDTRPWADQDSDKNNRKLPIDGANDGASGVGVLLELARQFHISPPRVGVDIILFDAEDYGAPEDFQGENKSDSWCLGSQYWGKNTHTSNYRAQYGILLDMVAAPNAKFYREQISDYYAKHIVDKVWDTASSLGFGQYFVNSMGGAITDDHLYVNQLAGIPSIDIIQYDPETPTHFGAYWHTMDDTMDQVDPTTLHAVGSTLMYVIYHE